ncbi:MAG: 50S ribosomal protein L5 [Candidatus Yanofskybacteria bacterium RIFCSPHIGHO2_02_FULL_41_11]|uniref:Large ribosomal subunit protein uL5 n=1 Tax=Candidatus Yanofskybacteria bacterium RIFCSPHIGHO2_02_FULL_41_11 TaxID=1802675 RepID=A0A1F8F9I1_9BACT|nr:MAG: 50S ribosomal protein L5 [Candidatus Yanofskybacteria bacterium RIFCSPHIGHO2_02_FULL_41_11]
MARLQEKYKKEVISAMQKEFGLNNIMSVPKINKVIINIGTGRILKDGKAIERVEKDLTLLSGQKPIVRKAKKSIAGFKTREGMEIGYSVTLRGKRMYDFLDRLISVALPRSKDFRGIDPKNVDQGGSLNLGIKEHSIFPEIQYENVKEIFGLQITVVTTARNREKGLRLLKLIGFPIKQ